MVKNNIYTQFFLYFINKYTAVEKKTNYKRPSLWAYDLSIQFSHFPLVNARTQAVSSLIQSEYKLLKINLDLVCDKWFLNNKVLYNLLKLLILQFLVCNNKVYCISLKHKCL